MTVCRIFFFSKSGSIWRYEVRQILSTFYGFSISRLSRVSYLEALTETFYTKFLILITYDDRKFRIIYSYHIMTLHTSIIYSARRVSAVNAKVTIPIPYLAPERIGNQRTAITASSRTRFDRSEKDTKSVEFYFVQSFTRKMRLNRHKLLIRLSFR